MSKSGAQEVVLVVSLLNNSDVQRHLATSALLYVEIIILFSQLLALAL